MSTPIFTTVRNMDEITKTGWYKLVDHHGIFRGHYRCGAGGTISLVSSLGHFMYQVENCQKCGEVHPAGTRA